LLYQLARRQYYFFLVGKAAKVEIVIAVSKLPRRIPLCLVEAVNADFLNSERL
jgi:hypothetical protein